MVKLLWRAVRVSKNNDHKVLKTNIIIMLPLAMSVIMITMIMLFLLIFQLMLYVFDDDDDDWEEVVVVVWSCVSVLFFPHFFFCFLLLFSFLVLFFFHSSFFFGCLFVKCCRWGKKSSNLYNNSLPWQKTLVLRRPYIGQVRLQIILSFFYLFNL